MTVDDAKAYLRLETGQEDALVERLVASATGLCEAFLGQPLVRREIVEMVAADGRWHRLSATPVQAIEDVTDAAGSALVGGRYAIDIGASGDGWVRADARLGRVRVSYHAGLADDAAGVPPPIAQGIIRLVAHLYAHRDDMAEPPAAIAALWRPFRRLRMVGGTRC